MGATKLLTIIAAESDIDGVETTAAITELKTYMKTYVYPSIALFNKDAQFTKDLPGIRKLAHQLLLVRALVIPFADGKAKDWVGAIADGLRATPPQTDDAIIAPIITQIVAAIKSAIPDAANRPSDTIVTLQAKDFINGRLWSNKEVGKCIEARFKTFKYQ